ncbi:SAM-dependent chlorinase/fluorinase, partial [Leptolyngbya cf. ectocarpi LEGE 11479]
MGVITLLTDFGHRDSYVGVMKGVIAGISPASQVVDLTHEIQPQAISAARFNLLMSYGYFPANTIHVVVVDPGVGTGRAAIAARVTTAAGVQTVIVPDNGILTGFPVIRAVALTNPEYWRTPQLSHTFHGRDLFAPVAAHLANGVALDELGTPLVVSSLVRLDVSDVVPSAQGYRGSIQYIDRFGNLITNIPAELLAGQSWQMQLGGHIISYAKTYGEQAAGTALALIGSHGYGEIAVNGGSAAQVFKTDVGDPVDLVTLPMG